MSDSQQDITTEQVTNTEKPKNAKRVEWGKKLGQLNKGRKKTITNEVSIEKETTNYYPFLWIGGIGLAGYVLYYTTKTIVKTETAPVTLTSVASKPSKSKQDLIL